jgi:tetratricopeptide (TPR) repeat protein/class 3 adenylate cyclase/tRNA A-37 threonylcarbamoyl transferase component Bud32
LRLLLYQEFSIFDTFGAITVPMIGTKLGPYQILEEISQGGMATVYRAYQPAMERQVAIKVIHQSILTDETAIERFRREARLVARLEHAHILPIYDFDGTHQPPYIVMPYMDSGTLSDLLQRRSLSLDEVSHFLQQIAGALDYAHRQGIIHRDIKPSNIMLDQDGNVFISDFGAARITPSSELGLESVSNITQTGAVIGTPDYIAPEQAMGEYKVGPTADIYALGVVLFQMLTGQLPYTGDTALSVILKHTHAPVPSAVALNPKLPPAVDTVLNRAMAKRPNERYPSASALVVALLEALNGPGAGRQFLSAAASFSGPAEPAELMRSALPSEQNKVVTAVYVDAVEYASLIEETNDLETARHAISLLWDTAKDIVDAHGGRVVSQAETHLLMLWGAEVAYEDDPEQAIRAAIAIQTVLRDHSQKYLSGEATDETSPLGIGINTGPALLSFAPVLTASGAAVSLAGRLAQQAGGKILISPNTFRHVLGIFDIEPGQSIKLRGRKDELQVYRIIAAKAQAFRINIREVEGIETKLIGREVELKRLQEAFFAAIEGRQLQMVTIVGAAGLGKSRLLAEFRAWAELRAELFWFFRGQATPSMLNRPYALLRDLLSYRFKLYDSDAPAVLREKLETGLAELISIANPETAHLIGYLAGFDFSDSPYIKDILNDPRQSTHLARQACIHMFAKFSEESPVFIQLEDLHWADDASLELFHELAGELRHLPLLLVSMARPILYERQPAWGSEQPFHHRIDLRSLSRHNSRLLIEEILQKMADPPRALIDLITERAEGNPYYIEELIKMLIEERVIQKGKEVWTVEMERLAHLPVPLTLMGLLQARMDSLLYPERIVLQRAAVIGRVFWDEAVAALESADGVEVGDVKHILQVLSARDFIYRRSTTAFAGNQEYSFAQNMLRDVIYEGLVKRQQHSYHVEVAAWLLRTGGDRAEEYAALIAEHYEKAGEDEKTAEFLAHAGKQAMQVGASREALAFYERALETLTPGPSTEAGRGRADLSLPAGEKWVENKIPILLKLGEIHCLLGDFPAAGRYLEDALALSRQINNDQGVAEALYQLSQVAIKQGNFARAQQRLAEGLPLARKINEPGTLGRTLYGLGDLIWRLGQYEGALPYLEESLLLARQNDDRRQIFVALNRLGTICNSSKAYPEARHRYEEARALALQVGNRRWLSTCFNNLGVVDYLEGNYLQARENFQEALTIAREAGQRDDEALYLLSLSDACFKLGDVAATKQYAQEALRLALALGGNLAAVYALVIFAELRAYANNTSGALALLGLAWHHPAADANTREEIERVLSELKLDPEAIEAGLMRGRFLDFEVVVRELLEEETRF